MANRQINCLIMTPKIRELKDSVKNGELSNLTDKDFLVLIESWQIKNNKDIDDIPTIEELNDELSTSPTAENNKPINIYYGSGENADLSNFAIRPFEYKGESFQSVEQAFQRAKFRYLKGDSGTRINNDELKSIKNFIMQTTNGKTLRILGRKIPIDRVRWDSESSDVMKEIITESFRQNPDALNKLLATGNATLTHNQDDSKWKTEFPRILMEVRSGLRQENNPATMPVNNKRQIITPIISTEQLASLKRYNPDLTFKNTRQRRDRVDLIARLFTTSATKLFRKKQSELLNQSNDNAIAADTLGTFNRDQFMVQNISTILDNVEHMFDESRASIEFLAKINRVKNKDWSDEQCIEEAEKLSPFYQKEFEKIRENWLPLLEEALPIIKTVENINIDLYNNEANQDINNDEGNDENRDNDNNDGDSEYNYKEGWMIKARQLNERDTLSVRVRKMLNSIVKVDRNGNIETDDLGFVRYIEPDYAQYILLNTVSEKVDEPYQLIDTLKEEAKNYRWINQVVNAINPLDTDSNEIKERKESLRAQFYSNFKKQFNPYYIEYFKENKDDGSIKVQTKPVNLRANISFVLNNWRDHIESGIVLDKLSIYNNQEEPNNDPNITDERNKFINDIENRLSLTRGTKDKTAVEVFLSNTKNADDIHRLTRILGIEIPIDDMILSLKEKSNLSDFIKNTKVIFNELKNVKQYKNQNGYDVYEDLLNSFNTASNKVAISLNYIPNSAIMKTFRENGNSYQSYTAPSYKGKVIKQIKKWNPKFMKEQYKDIDWFFNNGHWQNDWLSTMENSKEARDIFSEKTVLHSNKVDFNDWDDMKYGLAMLQEFLADPSGKTAWYAVPLQADVESADFIRFYRYSNEQCLNKMVTTVLQEWSRIQLVLARQDNPNIKKIAYFDIVKDKNGNDKGVTYNSEGEIISREDGAEFKFFPQLNTAKVQVGDNKILFIDWLNQMISADNVDMDSIVNEIKNQLTIIQNMKNESAFNTYKDKGVFQRTQNEKKYKYFPEYNNEEKLREVFNNYMWNYAHAYTQMVEIFTTDLAYYKNLNDFQKRFKEVYAMTLKSYYSDPADPNNTDKHPGKIRNIILADREIISNVANEINEIVDNQVSLGNMSKSEADYIKKTFGKEINVTDGQAFRSLKSFRRMMKSIGEWTPEMEGSYSRLQNGTFTIEDQQVMFQTVKPFVFTQVSQDSHIIDNLTGLPIKIKKPIQFKNSEALLLSIYGPQSKSAKLRGLIDFCDKYDIDVVQFSSAGKVGNQGVIDLESVDFESDKEYSDWLANQIMVDGQENPEVVHSIDMDDWGIVAANPEHLLDAEVLFGTQIRKLAIADLGRSDMFNVKGFDNPLTRDELVHEYSAIITATALKGLKTVYEELSDINQMEAILQKELASSSRYDDSLKEACKLIEDENGNKVFNIPLYDPIQSIRVQNLVNSIIKRRTVKHKIKGGSTTQASSYGVDNTINIRFFNNKGEFIFNEREWNNIDKVNKSQVKLLKEKRKEFNNDFSAYKAANKAASEAYWEVYMPVWDSRIYDICYDENTKSLDINKLPEELRYGIIERIPTEDKYSMQRIYVKDFLPSNTGSQLVLPADITAIVGADFDVDHNYDMMYDFDYFFSPKRAFRKLSKKEQERWSEDESIDNLLNNIDDSLDQDDDSNPWQRWINYIKENNPEAYADFVSDKDNWVIKPKSINKDKSYLEQSIGALDNASLDILTAILTNSSVAGRMVNPGNFDENKRVMYLLSILKNIDSETFNKEILPHINDMPYLKKMASQYNGIIDPTTPITQMNFHTANATGGKMIGIYANNNGNHSMMQYTDLELVTPIIINGKEYQSLHDSRVLDGNGNILYYISKQLASFLAASVDNVKEPTLSAFNQNDFTTAATCLMLRLGVPTQTIGLLLNQPAILEATTRYLNNVDRGKDAHAIIEEVIKVLGKAAKKNLSKEELDRIYNLKDDDLIKNILIFNKSEANKNIDKSFYYAYQIGVLRKFDELFDLGQELNNTTQAFRADTANGSNGPDIADTKIKQSRLSRLENSKLLDGIPSLPGYENIARKILNKEAFEYNDLMSEILSGQIPIIDAFTTSAIGGSTSIIEKYFPHYKEDIENAYDMFMSSLKPGTIISKKTINKFYEHLFIYSLMGLDTIGLSNVNMSPANAEFVRNYFNNQFPFDYEKLKGEKDEIKNNGFIKQLSLHKPNKKDHDLRIEFKNVGSLSKTQRGQYIKDWESLLFSNDPEISNLALNLFRYCIFKQGLNFGPKSFIHLTPPSIRLMYPKYMDRIRDIMDRDDNYDLFVDQFIRNNMDNTQLVPVISPESSFKFLTQDGLIAKNITIQLTKDSSRLDKNVAVSVGQVESDKFKNGWYLAVHPHSFFSTNINGMVVYYALDSTKLKDDGTTWEGSYFFIDKLNGHEYEYGREAKLMKTVDSVEQMNDKREKIDEEGESDYTNSEKYQAFQNSLAQSDIHNSGEIIDIFSKDNISSYKAEDKKDASGKPICK